MIDEVLASYAMTLDLVRRAVVDVPGDRAADQPPGLPNHPLWTLGHLTHSAEAIGGELGVAPWLPAGWAERYGTGSRPRADAGAYESLADLVARLDDGERRVRDGLRALGADVLAGPLPDVRHREVFPSLGHAVVHVLCSHTSVHAGQLMAWRRAMGMATEAAL